jgi:hypothetical protein
VLTIAEGLVMGDRQAAYGTPQDNHSLTAAFWRLYVDALLDRGKRITPRAVCMMNALQKISRDTFAEKDDNLIDVAGYMRCAQMVEGDDRENA